jgi:cytochrome P450
MSMKRVNVLSAQVVATARLSQIPELMVDKKKLMLDSVNYLQTVFKEHPDMVHFCHKDGRRELVPTDTSIYEEILSNEPVYGSPGEAENMHISQVIFGMPKETMAAHLHDFANGVKRTFQEQAEPVAEAIGKQMAAEFATWPSEGECSLDDLGDVLFWAMIEKLFGPMASKKVCPHLPKEFEKIDGHLFKMLRSGKVDDQVAKDIDGVVKIFEDGIRNGTATGPVPSLYHNILKGEPNQTPDAARMAVTAWWGGLGNTLPNGMNTLAYILGTPSVKEVAVKAARGEGEFGSDCGKRFLTACLKDSLRLCVSGGANRTVKQTHELTCASGRTYRIEKGTTIIMHFLTHHFDPSLHTDPDAFNPWRYLGATPREDQTGTVVKGVPFGWAPFSGGRHRCSGYALVMEEIPVALQTFLQTFDFDIIGELPGFDYSSRGFGVKFPVADIRIRYKKRV